jgi:small conductance mechanosensitive channel
MDVLMLWFIKGNAKTTIKNIPVPALVISTILLIVISLRVQCMTGILGCIVLFVCYMIIDKPSRTGLNALNSPVVLLGVLEVPTTPLITVLGAGGAAIALALKDSLGNIAGGMLILVNQPFKKGDEIDIGGTYGEVDKIDLFVTTLRTYDNKEITIPNGNINTSVIVNYSRRDRRRVDCKFGISYDSDIALAKSVLLRVAQSNPDIYTDPEPFVGVASHGDSSVVLDLKVWCDTEQYYAVKYYLTEQVKLAFDEADISIPFPQMDVHVVK